MIWTLPFADTDVATSVGLTGGFAAAAIILSPTLRYWMDWLKERRSAIAKEDAERRAFDAKLEADRISLSREQTAALVTFGQQVARMGEQLTKQGEMTARLAEQVAALMHEVRAARDGRSG